jgi:hypothetical protein
MAALNTPRRGNLFVPQDTFVATEQKQNVHLDTFAPQELSSRWIARLVRFFLYFLPLLSSSRPFAFPSFPPSPPLARLPSFLLSPRWGTCFLCRRRHLSQRHQPSFLPMFPF